MKHLIASALTTTTLVLGLAACGGSEGSARNGSQSQAANAANTASIATAPTAPTGKSTTTGGQGATPAQGAGASGGAAHAGSPDEGLPPPVARHERYPHGDTSIQTYGHEGADSDSRQITGAVQRFYAAVAAGDSTRICASLSASIARTLVQTFSRSPGLQGKGCPALVRALVKRPPGVSAAQLAEVHVAGVRVSGDKAFALLRSKLMPHGEIPMLRESGTWKVNAIAGSEIP